MGAACVRFCDEWRGTDPAEGARALLAMLPPRIPGGLRLVIARALRDLDVPAFASPDEFRFAVARFADRPIRDISDVRRARRRTCATLKGISRQTGIPLHALKQLEWGDYRDWRNDAAVARVCDAYANAAGLDAAVVRAIVDAERRLQVSLRAVAAPPRATRHRVPALLAAAAAVTIFVLGMIAGQVVNPLPLAKRSREVAVSTPPQPESSPPEATATESENVSPTPAPAEPAIPAAVPPTERRPAPAFLRKIESGEPTFSPWFSSVGSAVFYHRDEGVGSALVKAEPDGSTGDLRVITIVDDGARNYHVRPSPDGTRIAFDSDRDGERGVYVAEADGSNVRRVSGPGFAAVPSWSPDATRLAFVRGEARSNGRVWNLWLLDIPSSALVRLTSYAYGQPWGASWFPDGRRLAYSHEDQLVVLDLESGARRTFPSPREGRLLRTPAVSPDGRHVVFQVYRDGAWMLDVRNGAMRRILADPTAEEFAWDHTGRRLAFHSRRSGSWSVWVMAAER